MHKVAKFLQENSLEALLERTKCKAVRHKEYPNLVLLKYNMIDSPMGDELVQMCRGLILDEDNEWAVVSYPYDKFFNYGEGHAAEIDFDKSVVYEKIDGSLITLYCYDNKWHVASSGSPDASGPVEYKKPETFKELFWKVWDELGYKLPDTGEEDYCFMFELMTNQNRIIIPHEKNRIVLHGIRNINTFNETSPHKYIEDKYTKNVLWERIKTFKFNNFEEVLKSAETMDGIKQEGYVVCDINFNRIKLKAKTYVALHHLKSKIDEEPGQERKRLLAIVMANESSEFLQYFPEYLKQYNEVRKVFNDIVERVDSFYSVIKDTEVQKDFALIVTKWDFTGAYFSLRKGDIKSSREWFVQVGAKKIFDQFLSLGFLD